MRCPRVEGGQRCVGVEGGGEVERCARVEGGGER